MDSPKYGDRYFEIQQRLQANAARFAAAKAWNASRQLDRARADKDGVVRSDAEFDRMAKIILHTFNRYQVAEYNTAAARARTAKQWLDFNDDPQQNNLYPSLRWIPSRSATIREEHQAFYGLTLPKNHPFWRENQPGNLWNCKCDWEETADPDSQHIPKMNIRHKGLEGNPAETGEIFTANATYFKAMEQHQDKAFSDMLKLKENGFFTQKIGNTAVNIHLLHEPREIAGNLEVLTAFLNGRNDVKQVELLPVVSRANIGQRADFYPPGHEPRGKYNNADAIITFNDGKQWIVDFKDMQGNGNKLRDRIKDSYEQADYAIIKIKGTPKVDEITKMADSFMKQHGHFKEVFIYDNTEKLIYHRANESKK